VIDVVEQTFDIKLKNPTVLPTPLSRDSNCVQRRFSRPVTVGVWKEYGLETWLNGLLDHHLRHAICHSGHTQNPLASSLFGNGDGEHRRRKVGPRTHPVPDLVEISLQVGFELFEGLPVRTRRTTVGFHRSKRFQHLLFIDSKRLVCRTHRSPPVSSCFDDYDHLTPIPLLQSRYEPSSLLRIGPPQCSASVHSPCGFHRLNFSLHIGATGSCSSTRQPTSASRPLSAGHRLSRNQVPDRLIPEEIPASGFGNAFDLIDASSKGSLSFVSRMHTCTSSLARFPQRSPPRLLTAAAWRRFETCS